MSEKYRFKYNPVIWGFKRPETFPDMDLSNPINDMLDEALRPILSQINPFGMYYIELDHDRKTMTIKLKE